MNRKAWALAALGCCLAPFAQPLAQEPPAHMVAVEGGQVWTETCGKGAKVLLLLHDGVLHSADYDGVWSEFCKRYRVIRFDRRGYGRSPESKTPFSSEEDAVAVLRAEGVDRATVLGASDGGQIALRMAARFPERVERLVLIGPSISGMPVSDQFVAVNRARAAAFRTGGLPALAASDPYITAPGHDSIRAQALAILTANPQNLTHRDMAKPGPDTRSYLPAIKAKTLILVGDHDAPDVQAWAGAAEVLMPDAKRQVVTDAGHMLNLEKPQAFIDTVEAFVG